TALTVRNTAAVMVTGTLPGYAQEGVRIDVTAGAIGDAANLQGGLLILTSLKGVDGQVYAVAQGPVVTGGFVSGKAGNSQTVNHPTVGRVPGGAIVERASPTLPPSGKLKLQLRQPDFTTAVRVSEIVNKKFAGAAPVALAENSALISVTVPAEFAARVTEFVADIEALEVDVDRPAKVIVNERTGTIVMGKQVRVSPVAIMHGNLTVEIQTIMQVSQPEPFSQGKTAVVPQPTTTSAEEKSRNLVLKEGATVEQLVQALSSIGSSPRDIIAILQSLRAAGALEAELEVI
ncbi:MAG TPA: flagellar basal body P-ring protein FlgI, partial [Bryobacteraceae bacterium]